MAPNKQGKIKNTAGLQCVHVEISVENEFICYVCPDNGSSFLLKPITREDHHFFSISHFLSIVLKNSQLRRSIVILTQIHVGQ